MKDNKEEDKQVFDSMDAAADSVAAETLEEFRQPGALKEFLGSAEVVTGDAEGMQRITEATQSGEPFHFRIDH